MSKGNKGLTVRGEEKLSSRKGGKGSTGGSAGKKILCN